MKLGLLLPLLLAISGCALQGSQHHSYDEFLKENKSSVSLGKVVVNKAGGMFTAVNGSFEEIKNGQEEREYFLNFSIYNENIGRQCPNLKKGAKVIFLVGDQPYHYQTSRKSKISKNSFGLIIAGCQENDILVGPLTSDFIQNLLTQNVIRFKLYGENGEIEGRLLKEEIGEIRKFLTPDTKST
jgi:hypothetical protein